MDSVVIRETYYLIIYTCLFVKQESSSQKMYITEYREDFFLNGQSILGGFIGRCSYLYKKVFCKTLFCFEILKESYKEVP